MKRIFFIFLLNPIRNYKKWPAKKEKITKELWLHRKLFHKTGYEKVIKGTFDLPFKIHKYKNLSNIAPGSRSK